MNKTTIRPFLRLLFFLALPLGTLLVLANIAIPSAPAFERNPDPLPNEDRHMDSEQSLFNFAMVGVLEYHAPPALRDNAPNVQNVHWLTKTRGLSFRVTHPIRGKWGDRAQINISPPLLNMLASRSESDFPLTLTAGCRYLVLAKIEHGGEPISQLGNDALRDVYWINIDIPDRAMPGANPEDKHGSLNAEIKEYDAVNSGGVLFYPLAHHAGLYAHLLRQVRENKLMQDDLPLLLGRPLAEWEEEGGAHAMYILAPKRNANQLRAGEIILKVEKNDYFYLFLKLNNLREVNGIMLVPHNLAPRPGFGI